MRPVAQIAEQITQKDQLRGIYGHVLATKLAYKYDYINYTRPLREGNGRTQRELFGQLLSEPGRGLAWNLIGEAEFHDTCHATRATGDLKPLAVLFARVADDDPDYIYP